MKSREYKVTTYNPREGIYMVKSPIWVSEKMGQEQILMCRRYIRDKRTEELTKRNFHLVLSENFWRDVPFNLIFYPPNMKNERDRKQGKRFQGEIDYRNLDSLPKCGRCRMSGHNRKNCNNPGPSNV
ncbi:hypothetical protein M9H77_03487 [Catharanthus roseus]|uniref:Uncharacterized protein n=1 Tax=Catharanthus roseus TaxID=4058 RepID=A0ACC0CBV1_CATRO|nr:hypothetical protein M9H77_03487 [Catharanthus roseus]